ncbi:uncharacterized protein DUF3558 [Rhodococcus sp. OK519]|nr:uncharacterized protein DUF3558 [Rhodococcus sp. OK519]
MRSWGVAVLVVASVVGLAGCGSTSVEGQAETTRSEAGEPIFDPCSIPDEVLRAAGADPATESRDILGVKQPGWKLCDWGGDGTAITVFATAQALSEIQANDRFTSFMSIDLDDREAFTFREVTDKRNEYCDVVFAAGTDTVMIKSGYFAGRTPAEGPCPLAIRNARILAPSIPD